MLLTSSGSSACSSAPATPARISFANDRLMSPLAESERANPRTTAAACCGVVGAGPVGAGGGEEVRGVDAAADACGDRECPVGAAGSPPLANATPTITAI